jgi:hypothetical protein
LRMKLENDEVFDIEYTVRYQRKDTLSGPGINPSVTGAKNKNYGPYNLHGSDGESFSGTDFVSIGPDTIYNNLLYQTTTTDVVPYMGTGTVDLFYKSAVNTFAIGSDVYALAVTSQNKLNFTLTYSYCNNSVLPLNISNFKAALKDNQNVELSWTTQNELKTNTYEIELSENGKQFRTIGYQRPKAAEGTAAKYAYRHHLDQSPAGKLYYRIKQLDGKSARYSAVRSIYPGTARAGFVNIYPNPVVRNINLEFDEPLSGDFDVQLANQAGQIVYRNRTHMVNDHTMKLLVNDPPPPGIYFMKASKTGSSKVYSGKLLFTR